MTKRRASRLTRAKLGITFTAAVAAPACGGASHGAMAPREAAQAVHYEMAAEQEVYAPAQPMPLAEAPSHNTESYDHITDNPFLSVARYPLSTFSVDVDSASYSNVRRFLSGGSLPPADAVRIEELVNYFSYDYPDPKPGRPFSVVAEVAPAPWQPEHQLVHIGLQGKRVADKDLPPRNLVFLLDVSGSMDEPNKLPLLRRAMQQLVEGLGEQDRVAIVVYAGASGLVLPPTAGNQRNKILGALSELEAGGSTNGGAGIQLAYQVARSQMRPGSINRVILATDGDFNVGVTSEGELVRLIERERKSGVFLTVLGFGMGDYQDSKLEKLADHGNGNYGYIDTIHEARKMLVTQAGGTLFTIAKDVKLQVEFNPRLISAYRLIGYENRRLRDEDFNNDRKDAGDIGAGHSVTALYELVPAGMPAPSGSVDPLKYQQPSRANSASQSPELLTVKLRYKQPEGETSQLVELPVVGGKTALEQTSNAFRFSAAVAAWGMLLRDSEHKGSSSLELVSGLARGAVGTDHHGYRREFLELVGATRRLRPED
jgi:Ca-activated chloride channel family protein